MFNGSNGSHANYDEKRANHERFRRLMMQQSGASAALLWYRRTVGKRAGRRNRSPQTLTLPREIARRLHLTDRRVTVQGRMMMSANGPIGIVA